MAPRPWTPNEDDTLKRMAAEGSAWTMIGQAVNRKPNVCAQRYYRLLPPELRSIKSIAEINAEAVAMLDPETKAAFERRDEMTAARDARDDKALAQGNYTPVFFGDPPPGYSALDKRRANP